MCIGAGSVAAGILAFPAELRARPADRQVAATAEDELHLYWMSPRITSCGSCESKSWDRGKHCYACEDSGCNRLLQWFVDPATGEEYDGYFYPGVPISN